MINRFILNRLQQEITQPEINILLGPRQVGKTTLLKALADTAQSQNLKVAFFDLEQPQTLAEFNTSNQAIIEKIRASGHVVFIDEFQYLENASKIFKALYDSPVKIKLFCSGSSSLAIHKHLKESLAGRRFLFRIFPLQYAEIKQAQPLFQVKHYLRFGGMPALVHTGDESRKQIILAELVSAYILKDVKSLIREENIRAFNHLLYLLAQNQGSLISAHSLSKEINMSVHALNHYLDILEQTYTNTRIYSYSNNLGNELKKSCKSFFYDLGIRNALLKDFSEAENRPDKGAVLETFVFLQLQPLLQPNRELKFWRTKDGAEVDFILVKDRKPIPIEVKSTLSRLEAPSGLKRFLNRYPDTKKAWVINENLHGLIEEKKCTVEFITLEQFANQPELILE